MISDIHELKKNSVPIVKQIAFLNKVEKTVYHTLFKLFSNVQQEDWEQFFILW